MANKAQVRVFNRGANTYTHDEYKLTPGAFLDIPKELYEKWKDITEFSKVVIVLASEIPADKPQADAKLVSENADLKKQLAEMQKLLEAATKPGSLD